MEGIVLLQWLVNGAAPEDTAAGASRDRSRDRMYMTAIGAWVTGGLIVVV